MRKIKLNNITLDNQRKSPLYQAVIIDLRNAGVIDKTVAAGLLGEDIPDYLKLPKNFDTFVKDTVDDDEDDNDEEDDSAPGDSDNLAKNLLSV